MEQTSLQEKLKTEKTESIFSQSKPVKSVFLCS